MKNFISRIVQRNGWPYSLTSIWSMMLAFWEVKTVG